MSHEVIIIGGGAAGLMCALTAAQRGRQVLLIEHARQAGRKILMSGGGRCNFTNLDARPENFLSENPHFCKSALSRYTQWDFIALVEKHGIAYHEKEAGQLFCDESSRDIVNMLLRECADAGVELAVNCPVLGVSAQRGGFAVRTARGTRSCVSLVVASGGLSIPKMGATGLGYELAQQFGHTLVPTRAGLVPLTLGGSLRDEVAELSGLSQTVQVSVDGAQFTGGLLFTHRGLSGPAILQISSYWRAGQPLWVNWLPDRDLAASLLRAKRERPRLELATVLAEMLPKRLALRLCAWAQCAGTVGHLGDSYLRALAAQVQRWEFAPSGSEGYRTAEVTLGGVSTAEVSSSTLESRRQPGLYFIGEVLDVTGHLGGYNFQWAWASGHAAGEVV